MEIMLQPVATIGNSRIEPVNDHWEAIIADVELAGDIHTEASDNISAFSNLEIIYDFNKVIKEYIVLSGRPRGHLQYPLVGMLVQRKKDQPNSIGPTTVELLEREIIPSLNGRKLFLYPKIRCDKSSVLSG